jgi:geranylgeranyl diphosphate synthase type I
MEAVRARMRDAVTFGPPLEQLGSWLAYHLGWAELDGSPAHARRAKEFRPRVCLAACRACQGDPAEAVHAAAAVELTHEFSLIHDDIEDGDTTRRGRPALWSRIGLPQALNAGDVLFAVARGELGRARVSERVALALVRRYDRSTLELAQGQYLDLAFEKEAQVGFADAEMYLKMAELKSGALIGLAGALGALVSNAPDAADALDAFGRRLGVAFQIADDVLGLWGDPEVTGKPAGADLVRGKKSYPVCLALADPDLADRLTKAGDGARNPHELAGALATLEAHGIRARAEADARKHMADALRELDRVALEPSGKRELTVLAGAATERIS